MCELVKYPTGLKHHVKVRVLRAKKVIEPRVLSRTFITHFRQTIVSACIAALVEAATMWLPTNCLISWGWSKPLCVTGRASALNLPVTGRRAWAFFIHHRWLNWAFTRLTVWAIFAVGNCGSVKSRLNPRITDGLTEYRFRSDKLQLAWGVIWQKVKRPRL